MLNRSCTSFLGFVLIACGGSEPEPAGQSAAGAQADAPPSERRDDPNAVRFLLTGEGAPLGEALSGALLNGAARLEVREQNPVVNLAVTGVFEQNTSNLVQLQLSVLGVENAMGLHHIEIGPPTYSAAYMQAYLELQSYSSRSGLLDVTLAGDGSISGSLEAELFKDSEPGKLDELGERIAISASFEGSWSLICSSPVPALPGDHSVSDSAYCNGLTF